MMQRNLAEEISLIYIHMQMCIPRRKKKDIILRVKWGKKRGGGGEEGEGGLSGKFSLSPLNRCLNYVLVRLSEPERSKAPALGLSE